MSEIPGRTRLQLAGPVPESDLDALLKLSGDIDGVHKVRVYGRIGQMALEYDEPHRDAVLAAVGALDAQAIADAKTGYVMQLEPRKHKLVMDLATLFGAHYARRRFFPRPCVRCLSWPVTSHFCAPPSVSSRSRAWLAC